MHFEHEGEGGYADRASYGGHIGGTSINSCLHPARSGISGTLPKLLSMLPLLHLLLLLVVLELLVRALLFIYLMIVLLLLTAFAEPSEDGSFTRVAKRKALTHLCVMLKNLASPTRSCAEVRQSPSVHLHTGRFQQLEKR